MANNLQVGYARVNVTPPLGVNLAGYYKVRFADGVLDELEVCAVAVKAGDDTVIVVTRSEDDSRRLCDYLASAVE